MFRRIISFFKTPDFSEADNDGVEIEFKYLTKDRKRKKLKEIFSNLPRFETKRLVLRRVEFRDCESMFEYSSDPEVAKYLSWTPHRSITETRDYINNIQKKYENGQFFDWGLVCKSNGEFIGTCGFTSVNLNRNTCEIGYVLSKKYWGMGFVPEAVEVIMDFAFGYMGVDKVEGRFIEGNVKSMRVMQKVGMTFEKSEHNVLYLHGQYRTICTYSITRNTFENRKNALNKIVWK